MLQRKVRLEILCGWKEIASYLHLGIRTAQRYEREFGLPIHRPASKPKGAVIATKAELDAWVSAKPVRHAFHLPRPITIGSPLLENMRRNLEEMKRLSIESVQLTFDETAALNSIRNSIRVSVPESLQDAKTSLPEIGKLLSFDPKRKSVQ
jgi:hypothetical protein